MFSKQIFAVIFLSFGILASAGSPGKSVVITYPSNTPDSILSQAKRAITDAGGIITYEYSLLKGFAARASSQALDTVNTLGASYKPAIEEDIVVSTNNEETTI